jgi:hypothetical protein
VQLLSRQLLCNNKFKNIEVRYTLFIQRQFNIICNTDDIIPKLLSITFGILSSDGSTKISQYPTMPDYICPKNTKMYISYAKHVHDFDMNITINHTEVAFKDG